MDGVWLVWEIRINFVPGLDLAILNMHQCNLFLISATICLRALSVMHGYMTSRYLPDCPRSSRYVLKDVNGRLLYCHPPPGLDAAHSQATPTLEEGGITHPGRQGSEGDLKLKAKMSAHSKGTHGVSKYVCTERLQKVSAELSLNLLNTV